MPADSKPIAKHVTEGGAPIWRKPMLTTPFFECYEPLVETRAFRMWGGYNTLTYFSSIEHEYFAIRNTTSVFDLTPMVKYDIRGPGAEDFLSRLLTRDVRKLKKNRVTYTMWCDDDGNVIDDGTVFKLGKDKYRLCTAERQLDWFLDSAIGFDVSIREITADIAALALQGPTSCSTLKHLGFEGVENLKPFEIGHFGQLGYEVMVSRTGFTGDLGYELWLDPSDAKPFWNSLMEAGSHRGIRPIGYGALEMARIEAGLLLPDSEFVNAEFTLRVNRGRTQLELGMDWLVDFEKGHFTGRRALLEQKKQGVPRMLVGLEVDGKKPAHDALVFDKEHGGREIGFTTCSLWSPTLKNNIAMALIDAPHYKGEGELWAEFYIKRELVWQKRRVRCKVVPRPFFAPERRKLTPPLDR
jgi:aminomethyltransferase